ncbi:MAG: hypothetical protein GY800_03470 [Planctomycetes bacterium]|nr:hypothetical protein [Planctomycetota bacterium]
MPRRRSINSILLGPIVGHTDHGSTRVWIRAAGEPSDYSLRVTGHGVFPFVSTEGERREFGTAIATAYGLRPEWRYRYQVLFRGRVVSRGQGSFRTMPAPGSMADILYFSLSCNDQRKPGAWDLLSDAIDRFEPRFLLMTGDQVYLDYGSSNVWKAHWDAKDRVERRRAMAEIYQTAWSREPVAHVLANTPTYMVWDDHEIRDGWGSVAGDSPTLARRYPRGEHITALFRSYFEDAHEVYWHFQACHNPGRREGTVHPYVFRCGRLAVLVVDGRGVRDVWRETYPILGVRQWRFINQVLEGLDRDVDALGVVTPVPIVATSTGSEMFRTLGDRHDDVDVYKKGDLDGLLEVMAHDDDWKDWVGVFADKLVPLPVNFGDFKLAEIDDVRDQWAHSFSRKEQIKLLRDVASAAFYNRLPSAPRGVVFMGGDIHIGAQFKIRFSRPEFSTECLVASAISSNPPAELEAGVLVDDSFQVAKGISAELENAVRANNFGLTHITFSGATPEIHNAVVHEGEAAYRTLDIAGMGDIWRG